jgi:glyoxylase-like metal-dependent hydrolase (beta-lactamase superfamily II)
MMKVTVACAALLILMAAQVPAELIEGLPLHVERLGERGIRLWIGDYQSTTAVNALATRDGIVVIDATDMPAADVRFREIIAEELGRDDFRYFILTHEHGDHWIGASVWSDCQVIAHERALKGMQERIGTLPRSIEWHRSHLQETADAIAAAETEEAAGIAKEQLLSSKARLAAMESGVKPPVPDITFSKRLTLDMGDVTLELSYAGGIHSSSDIFIFVPEEGLLFTGDTMADIWHTDRPGCLAAFRIRPGVEHDFPLLLDNWAGLLARKDEIKDLIPGHWNGDITLEGFENRYNYVKTMWEGIGEAAKSNPSVEDLFARFGLAANFPELVDSPGFSPENHATSIVELWREVTGAESAALRMRNTLDAEGVEQAVAEIKSLHARGSSDFYFMEHEFNALGYQYLTEEKVDEAKAIFRFNSELYPESWNVWDSLAEAHMVSGDRATAIDLYERSLKINPDNSNGKDMLKRLTAGG